MAILRIHPHDGLVESLRIALEGIVKCQICDPDEDFPEVRDDALATLRRLRLQAAIHGYTLEELYDCLVAGEEARADFQAEWEDVELD